MSKPFDRYNLAGRLEKFGDQLMTACEKGEAIENRIDVCNQVGAVCRIAMTLKALRMEDHRADPDDAIAGSAGSTAEPASDSAIASAAGSFADSGDD